jgi:predicted amidophosphoribosyltransferase
MQLLDAILELAFPTRCAGCELPGDVICPTCRDNLPRVDPATSCPRCGAPYGTLVCTECWDTQWAFEGTISFGELEAPLARMVVLHKDAGERRLGPLLGTLLAERIAREWPSWADAVTYVPATREALQRRGFDHGRAIATALAEQLGVPLISALVRGRTPVSYTHLTLPTN